MILIEKGNFKYNNYKDIWEITPTKTRFKLNNSTERLMIRIGIKQAKPIETFNIQFHKPFATNPLISLSIQKNKYKICVCVESFIIVDVNRTIL